MLHLGMIQNVEVIQKNPINEDEIPDITLGYDPKCVSDPGNPGNQGKILVITLG